MLKPLTITLALLLAAGCAERTGPVPLGGPNTAPEAGPEVVQRRAGAPGTAPVLRWARQPEGERWTAATLEALRGHGAVLPATVPAGIEAWCPAYATASQADREAFWAGLLSALAQHESTYRQTAVGGGGRWFGLTQILPATAEGYGCRARSGAALKDGVANLSCAVRIMATRVRGGDAARGVSGIATDWGPFHQTAKREDMRAWVRAQPFCTPD